VVPGRVGHSIGEREFFGRFDSFSPSRVNHRVRRKGWGKEGPDTNLTHTWQMGGGMRDDVGKGNVEKGCWTAWSNTVVKRD